MKFKWTDITESEYKRLVKRCNFTAVELQILDLRRKGIAPDEVAEKVFYTERQMYRISKTIVSKIKRES